METICLKSEIDAARRLRDGQLVAIPTETVFGLAADATNETAVNKIFIAKGRPSDNPLIVHLADATQWRLAASQLTESAAVLLQAFAPGPITVVLPKCASISERVTAGLDTVAIRIPSCPITHRVLAAARIPIAAPSANLSGKPSCTTWQSVLEDLDGRIDAILCENPKTFGLESTVVDCCQEQPILLRPGAITIDDIRRHFPSARTATDETISAMPKTAPGIDFNSPGLKHPHYRPNAEVKLFENLSKLSDDCQATVSELCSGAACCCLDEIPSGMVCALGRQFASVEEYAAGFYEFLREADRRRVKTIYVQLAPPHGIGLALRDRQLRAAGIL